MGDNRNLPLFYDTPLVKRMVLRLTPVATLLGALMLIGYAAFVVGNLERWRLVVAPVWLKLAFVAMMLFPAIRSFWIKGESKDAGALYAAISMLLFLMSQLSL